MAKVLRGGKWGSVPSRSNSRANGLPSQKTEREAREYSAYKQRVLISFVEHNRHLGVAVYDPSVNDIFISRVPRDEDYHYASRIVSLYDQCFIILPKSYLENDRLMNAIRPNFIPRTARDHSHPSNGSPELCTTSSGSLSPSDCENSISFLPSLEFSLFKARELCSLIRVVDMPKSMEPDSRFLYLSHILGGENVIIRAIGGLLSFILQQGVLGALHKGTEDICINAIYPKNYCQGMRISQTVSKSLHIFNNEAHPLGRGCMRGKEGLSLYGILKGHLKTVAGRNLLRSWLVYPLTDQKQIQERQRCVQDLRDNSRRALLATIRDALRGVKNVEGILGRMQRHSTEALDWQAMHSSTSSFIFIIEALKTAAQQDDVLLQSFLVTRALRVDESHLREPTRWIESAVDFEECKTADRMVVAAGFSSEIDDLKRTYSGLDDFLTNIGMNELAKMTESDNTLRIKSFNFKYQTQVGFLIAVPADECENIGLEILEKEGMSFMFKSDDDGYHFKNQKCYDLDEEIGDIHGAILELEAHACRYLEAKVLEYTRTLKEISSIVKELDCLQAFAVAANEYSWIMPVVVNDGRGIEIEEGRHPLMELIVPTFVPNSTRMRMGDVHVVSGPNYSGKSIYLTQVALITVLTQIGCCIPAKRAKMPVIDSINGRISTSESIASGSSIFFKDASQVASMLREHSERSLNILDEFGNGTAGPDGMALLASVIHELATKDGEVAITLCATHFVEILGEPFLPLSNPRIGLFSMEVQLKHVSSTKDVEPPKTRRRISSEAHGTMDMTRQSSIIERDRDEDSILDSSVSNDVIRTYRLVSGSICHESRALHCALEAKIPRFVLQRAAQVREAICRPGKIPNVVCTEQNSVRMRVLSNDVRAFLKTKLDDVVQGNKQTNILYSS